MKDREQDLFLNEILASEDLEALRRSSLKQALSQVRKKRRSRQLALVCLLGFALAAPVLLLVGRRPITSPAPGNRFGTTVARLAVPSRERETIEKIGDQELLALFPKQSIALVGAPGERRLLVFAAPSAQNPARHLRTPAL